MRLPTADTEGSSEVTVERIETSVRAVLFILQRCKRRNFGEQILALDALVATRIDQFSMTNMHREFVKAYSSFSTPDVVFGRSAGTILLHLLSFWM